MRVATQESCRAVEILPSASGVGAEIRGIDLSVGITQPGFEDIRDALHRYSVLWLRNQKISIHQQLDFCRLFGAPEPHATSYHVPGYPDVLCVSNVIDEAGKPIGITDAGRVWHTDGHFENRPTMYSMLYAIEVPTDGQGQTLGATWFASTADAYDALSDSTKQRIEGLVGENTMVQMYRYYAARNLATKRLPLTEAQRQKVGIHPVVRTHPATRRKCLYVSEAHTERVQGLSQEEAARLVQELQRHCIQEPFIYRHRWQVGDLLIWDNCSSQHMAIGDYGQAQRRLMHRVSVAGAATF